MALHVVINIVVILLSLFTGAEPHTTFPIDGTLVTPSNDLVLQSANQPQVDPASHGVSPRVKPFAATPHSAEQGTKTEKQAAASPDAVSPEVLAKELYNKGWIAFSAKTELGDWDLFICRPDGTDRQALTHTPDMNEAGVRFSPDGKSMLYYQMPKSEPLDNNTYGTFDLVIAHTDGSKPVVLGNEYKWAAWGPDSRQLACLDDKEIRIIETASRKVVRKVPRHGMVQQLGWSPDGRWFTGTANGLGPYWNIARVNAKTGESIAVSETDRYNCTPDWLHDSQQIVYSRGIIPNQGGFAELWIASLDGKTRRTVYAQEKIHLYGGCISPDGRYMLFTRSEEDLGKVDNSRTSMSIIRMSDAPVIVGDDPVLRKRFPKAKSGPRMDLLWGWEPDWTDQEIDLGKQPK